MLPYLIGWFFTGEPSPRGARTHHLGLGHGQCASGAGHGAARRPGAHRGAGGAASSASRRHPSQMRKVVPVTMTRVRTGAGPGTPPLTPPGKAWLGVLRTIRCRPSSDQSGTSRSPEPSRSPSVTSTPVSARRPRVSAVRQPREGGGGGREEEGGGGEGGGGGDRLASIRQQGGLYRCAARDRG